MEIYTSSSTKEPSSESVFITPTIEESALLQDYVASTINNSILKSVYLEPTIFESTQPTIINKNKKSITYEYKCINKTNGYYYEKKCSSSFIICINGFFNNLI